MRELAKLIAEMNEMDTHFTPGMEDGPPHQRVGSVLTGLRDFSREPSIQEQSAHDIQRQVELVRRLAGDAEDAAMDIDSDQDMVLTLLNKVVSAAEKAIKKVKAFKNRM